LELCTKPLDKKSTEEIKQLKSTIEAQVASLRHILSQHRSLWGGKKNTASLEIFDRKLHTGMQKGVQKGVQK
jgi:hypothetical protein